MNKYIISFGGLPSGEYTFSYILDDAFFANFETSEIKNASIESQVTLEKKQHTVLLNCSLCGSVKMECDRCLDVFDLPVEYEATLYIKSGISEDDDIDEVVVIPENENEINIAQYLYEFAILSLPIRRVHPEDEDGENNCNPVMIEKLNKFSAPEVADIENNIFKDLKNFIN